MIRKTSATIMLLALTLTIGGCGGGGGSAAATDSPSTGYTGPGNVPGEPGNGDSSGQPAGPGTAAFAWDAPATNEDGTTLTDLAGYKLYYGTAPGSYTSSVRVGQATAYALTGLAPGTYYAVVTAYNASGAESIYSNEVAKAVF